MDFKKIKLLVLDCDGVLSDGKMIYINDHNQAKNFNAYDGMGINLLKFSDIEVAVVTGSKSSAIAMRCEHLKIARCHQLVTNKVAVVTRIMQEIGLTWENVAYVGDDWNDYPVMRRVAFAATVASATPDFKAKIGFVTHLAGGKGAVREVIEYILKQQGTYEKVIQKFLDHAENH